MDGPDVIFCKAFKFNYLTIFTYPDGDNPLHTIAINPDTNVNIYDHQCTQHAMIDGYSYIGKDRRSADDLVLTSSASRIRAS